MTPLAMLERRPVPSRDLGPACAEYQNRTVRNLPTKRIECGEIWAYVAAKQRNVPIEHRGEFGWGDVWTWVAVDQDSRRIITWLVGTRDEWAARDFIADPRAPTMAAGLADHIWTCEEIAALLE